MKGFCGSLIYPLRDIKTYTRVKVDFTYRVFNYVRSHVNSTRVNKMEATYYLSRVKVKVERVSTFRFTRDLS